MLHSTQTQRTLRSRSDTGSRRTLVCGLENQAFRIEPPRSVQVPCGKSRYHATVGAARDLPPRRGSLQPSPSARLQLIAAPGRPEILASAKRGAEVSRRPAPSSQGSAAESRNRRLDLDEDNRPVSFRGCRRSQAVCPNMMPAASPRRPAVPTAAVVCREKCLPERRPPGRSLEIAPA